MVVGHVDGIGTLLERHEDARSTRMRFELPEALARYVARKGSVCINGVSLTVNDVEANRFGVNIIPHTLAQTTLRSEEHTSELQSLMRTSYAVFCLKKKTKQQSL